MGLVLFASNIIKNIGDKYDIEAQLDDVTKEISQLQQLGSILADGIIEGHELDGLDYNNIPHLIDFQQKTARTVGQELNPAFNFFKRQYPPQERDSLRNYLMKSILAKKGRQKEQLLHAREQQLMQKKAKLEARLRMIESTQKSYEQGAGEALKSFAPKFAGGGQ